MKIERNQIRAIKGTHLIHREYWFHAEILVDGKWIEPFLVDEEKLKWFDTSEKIYIASDKPVKEFLERKLRGINERFSDGYKLVNYEKYKEVIHRFHYPDEFVPSTVYLED